MKIERKKEREERKTERKKEVGETKRKKEIRKKQTEEIKKQTNKQKKQTERKKEKKKKRKRERKNLSFPLINHYGSIWWNYVFLQSVKKTKKYFSRLSGHLHHHYHYPGEYFLALAENQGPNLGHCVYFRNFYEHDILFRLTRKMPEGNSQRILL